MCIAMNFGSPTQPRTQDPVLVHLDNVYSTRLNQEAYH